MQTRPPDESLQSIAAELVEDDAVISFAQLCHRCGVSAEAIMTLVDEGVIEPHDRATIQWSFTVTSVRRVSTAIRLQRDLDVNLPGVALALELLDRIKALETRVSTRVE